MASYRCFFGSPSTRQASGACIYLIIETPAIPAVETMLIAYVFHLTVKIQRPTDCGRARSNAFVFVRTEFCCNQLGSNSTYSS